MKNEYTVDWPLLKQWTKESCCRGIRLKFLIMWCVLLVAMFGTGIVMFILLTLSDAAYFFLLALFCGYRAFLHPLLIAKGQYKRFTQIYGKNSWIRTIAFEEDVIRITEEKTEMEYLYADVVSITEKGETIYLTMSGKACFRLYRSKFVNTTWEECKAFILSKNPHIQ